MNRLLAIPAVILFLATGSSASAGESAAVPRLGISIPLNELVTLSEPELSVTLQDLSALGVRLLRTDFWWDKVQPTAGASFRWSRLDRLVEQASRLGFSMLPILGGCPGWLRSTGGIGSDASVKAYAAYAGAAAEHFRGKIRYWEIWNEPNLDGSWCSAPDPAQYSRVLKAAYRSIKAVEPTDLVVTGGLSPVPVSQGRHIAALEFLSRMYDNHVSDSFDALGFHPYSWPNLPRDPVPWSGWHIMERQIHPLMSAHGDGARQIWITEMGAPTDGNRMGLSPEKQRQTLQQAVMIARSESWIGPVIWHTYRDRGRNRNDTEDWYGLVGAHGEPKPAYQMLKALGRSPGG